MLGCSNRSLGIQFYGSAFPHTQLSIATNVVWGMALSTATQTTSHQRTNHLELLPPWHWTTGQERRKTGEKGEYFEVLRTNQKFKARYSVRISRGSDGKPYTLQEVIRNVCGVSYRFGECIVDGIGRTATCILSVTFYIKYLSPLFFFLSCSVSHMPTIFKYIQ